MTLLLVVGLVVAAVATWPNQRPSSRHVWRSGLGRTTRGAAAIARVRTLLARDVRVGRPRSRGWVAEFAELAAVGLEAGLPSVEAARLACAVGASPMHPETEALAVRLAAGDETGRPVGDVLADAATGDRDLSFLAAAWRLADDFGVAAAPAARTASEVLRERSAAEDRRTVLAAGPRASMWLLTVLPLSGPLVALLLGLPVSEVYGGAAAGVAAGTGLVLTSVGWLWSRAVLRRALRPAEVSS